MGFSGQDGENKYEGFENDDGNDEEDELSE